MNSNVSTFKKYDFVCEACNEEFSAMMWVERGVPEGKECPKCNTLLMPAGAKSSDSVMINTRENWQNKLPSDWTNFLGSFEKRHSKYGRTVNTHSRGRSEH